MKAKLSLAITTLQTLGLLLGACSPAGGEPTATPAPDSGQVVVESLEILMLESFPVQIQLIVRGTLPDACTAIADITQTREDNTFRVTLMTSRPQDAACATVITPFEQTVKLDVVGLKAGAYTVMVDGKSETFELAVDNVLPG